MVEFAYLAPLGFAVGAYGTLVGAGGGSLLGSRAVIYAARCDARHR